MVICVSESMFKTSFRLLHNVFMGSDEEKILQGDFGETWLRAVAAASGLLHGRPTTLDLEKADVELVRTGFWNGAWNPTVKVQVKTTVDLRMEDGDFLYDEGHSREAPKMSLRWPRRALRARAGRSPDGRGNYRDFPIFRTSSQLLIAEI